MSFVPIHWRKVFSTNETGAVVPLLTKAAASRHPSHAGAGNALHSVIAMTVWRTLTTIDVGNVTQGLGDHQALTSIPRHFAIGGCSFFVCALTPEEGDGDWAGAGGVLALTETRTP